MSLSTHVLDTSLGQPAAGVAVRLEEHTDGGWRERERGTTNSDGRITGWDANVGVHRLVFDIAAYHGSSAFYPEVIVVFRISEPSEHCHVPLLISPFGYSTYKGS